MNSPGARHIVLRDHAERSGNKTSQPGDIAWGVNIASDSSKPKYRKALEAGVSDLLLLQAMRLRESTRFTLAVIRIKCTVTVSLSP